MCFWTPSEERLLRGGQSTLGEEENSQPPTLWKSGDGIGPDRRPLPLNHVATCVHVRETQYWYRLSPLIECFTVLIGCPVILFDNCSIFFFILSHCYTSVCPFAPVAAPFRGDSLSELFQRFLSLLLFFKLFFFF